MTCSAPSSWPKTSPRRLTVSGTFAASQAVATTTGMPKLLSCSVASCHTALRGSTTTSGSRSAIAS